MAHLTGNLFLDEGDDVGSQAFDANGRQWVTIRLGQIAVHVYPEQLDLLRRLATATAEAERDLEAIIAKAAA